MGIGRCGYSLASSGLYEVAPLRQVPVDEFPSRRPVIVNDVASRRQVAVDVVAPQRLDALKNVVANF